MHRTAVVLFSLGGPDSLEAIEPFLFNLFCDPDIFKIPIGQKLFARTIAHYRTPIVRRKYELIGGKSPLNEWTEKQRILLEEELKKEIKEVKVFTAMRYWKPLTSAAAKKVKDGKFNYIVLLPLYPHYSISTIGSAFNEWKRVYPGNTDNHIYIKKYYDNLNYIKAINERIDSALKRFPKNVYNDVEFVFSAHSTPVKMAEKGDPYGYQIKETVDLVMNNRNHSHHYHLCFQSKVGPVKWLSPNPAQVIKELAAEGKKHLLFIPISFTADHFETLYELGIQYRELAEKEGIENYIVMQGLNDSSLFISALKEITLNAINHNRKNS